MATAARRQTTPAARRGDAPAAWESTHGPVLRMAQAGERAVDAAPRAAHLREVRDVRGFRDARGVRDGQAVRQVRGGRGAPRRPAPAVYVRRRLAALTLLVLAIAGLLTLLAPNSGAAPTHEPDPLLLVVGPGDTVLELVRPHVPEGKDPRGFAAEVLEASGLDGRAVRPGAVLRLPRS